MACLITSGAVADCASIKPGGIKQYAYLYNYSEWRDMIDAAKVTIGVDRTITNIVNGTGVKAYKFEVWDETGIIPMQELVAQEGNVSMYTHGLNLSIVEIDQEDINNVDKMRVEKMVAIILRNDGKGMCYGITQGMKLTANNFNPQDAAIGSVIPIELRTSDTGAKEPYAPCTIFDTDAATTKALLDGLTVAGV
jgi:hypothetical protein